MLARMLPLLAVVVLVAPLWFSPQAGAQGIEVVHDNPVDSNAVGVRANHNGKMRGGVVIEVVNDTDGVRNIVVVVAGGGGQVFRTKNLLSGTGVSYRFSLHQLGGRSLRVARWSPEEPYPGDSGGYAHLTIPEEGFSSVRITAQN